MSVAVITERIRASLAAGALKEAPPLATFGRIATIATLLRPWSEVFPGVADDDDFQTNREIFGVGSDLLRRPTFNPQPRRSRRGLLPPRSVSAPDKTISPRMFRAISAIWQWYGQRDLADPALLDLNFSPEGLNRFVHPLHNKCEYPIGLYLEEFGYHDDLYSIDPPSLILPHYHWDEEGSGVVEALFSGANGFDWYLRDIVKRDDFLNLSKSDRKLIADIGTTDLAITYFEHTGPKRLPLEKLEEWTDHYFAQVQKDYPEIDLAHVALVCSDPTEVEVVIGSPRDIDFVFAYAEAHAAMFAAIPYPYEIDSNSEGITDALVKEVCDIWRQSGRKKTVKKIPTLSERIANGDL